MTRSLVSVVPAVPNVSRVLVQGASEGLCESEWRRIVGTTLSRRVVPALTHTSHGHR